MKQHEGEDQQKMVPSTLWRVSNDDDDCDGNEKKKRTGTASMVTYQTLSAGGGVTDGEAPSSPGCSGMSVSVGPEPAMPGGVEEVLRASVAEPLRDTQEVSITRTPMLWTHTHTQTRSQTG